MKFCYFFCTISYFRKSWQFYFYCFLAINRYYQDQFSIFLWQKNQIMHLFSIILLTWGLILFRNMQLVYLLLTNSVTKRHFYGFSGGKNVGFYLSISYLTLPNFFFSVYVLNIVKKRCCLQYSCHCVAFTLTTTPKIYVTCMILPPGFSDFKILISP